MGTVEVPHRHQEIGARIRKLRESTAAAQPDKRAISQERFAPLVGVTRRHLIRLENGEHRPSRALAARIEQTVEEITGEPVQERILPDDEDEEPHPLVATLESVIRQLVRAEFALAHAEMERHRA